MNIAQAKEYIKNDVSLYLKKDEYGDYRIPVERQRPIFLLGAPGIGKTAIMEQIAGEMGIALVAYSMTHHTRQSALGLPFIKQKTYRGKTYDVSEYTMSEIIASVYDTMEESGVTEGILFLDEINCVSETLAPSMLQFLQYKVFGKHQVPEGWVIVVAGNPPLYNRSVRTFDVATLDRLKVLEVAADYPTWKVYAGERGIHGAVTGFLDANRDDFYSVETVAGERNYITARGWEDVSDIIKLYEEESLPVDETLVGQYIRNERVVKEFTAYYDLYLRYRKDYRADEILEGRISDAAVEQAKRARLDERLSLLSLLSDRVKCAMRDAVATSDYLKDLMPILSVVKDADDVGESVEAARAIAERALQKRKAAGALSAEEKRRRKRTLAFLSGVSGSDTFAAIEEKFQAEVAGMKQSVSEAQEMLKHLYTFAGKAFDEERELLVLTTELTVDTGAARFIAMFGSEEYRHYQELLMVSKRQDMMKQEIMEWSLGKEG